MTSSSYFVELPGYSAIDVCGVDTSKFLQGQLTINTTTPSQTKACFAALCNPKGRIVSLFHIVAIDQGMRLLMPSSLIEITLAHLKKYGVFFKVEITHATVASLYGAVNISAEQLSSFKHTGQLQDFYQLGELSLALVLSKDEQSILALNQEHQFIPETNQQNWFWQMAEHKISWLTADTSEKFLPHNLDLPRLSAVDFKKGCFTGQEVIARMQYKGKLKQRLQLLKGHKIAGFSPEEPLYQDDKKVGEIVCYVNNLEKGCLVLALIKDNSNYQQNFTSKSENSPILELVE